MTYICRYLTIHEIDEGMVLAAPLRILEQGVLRFSLPEGHVLTADNLRQLRLRQAEVAFIRVEDLRVDSERARDAAAAEARLRQIFRVADLQMPVVAGLFNAVLAYRKLK